MQTSDHKDVGSISRIIRLIGWWTSQIDDVQEGRGSVDLIEQITRANDSRSCESSCLRLMASLGTLLLLRRRGY